MIRQMLLLPLLFLSASVAAQPDKARDAVKAEIWAKEQAIYAARGRGDIGPYRDSIAQDYRAWPPNGAPPAGSAGLDRLAGEMAKQTQEKLTMTLVDFSLNGDAAVIYYATHRTQMPDGSPADERFQVIHSWVREGGQWKVLGGMARRVTEPDKTR